MFEAKFLALPRPDNNCMVKYFTTADMLEGTKLFDHTFKIELIREFPEYGEIVREYALFMDDKKRLITEYTHMPIDSKKDTTMWGIYVQRLLCYSHGEIVDYIDTSKGIKKCKSIIPVEAWMYTDSTWNAIYNAYDGFPLYEYYPDQTVMNLYN